MELIAPTVGGVKSSTGELVPAQQKVVGGPSVLYDFVALLLSADGVAKLAKNPAAKQFATDAFNHF